MQLEAIERRCLWSHTLTDGLLAVDGTAQADEVGLSLDGTTLVLVDNGQTARFVAGSVSAIEIDVAAGDDRVIMVNEIALPTTIVGGEGNDNLGAGGGNDSLRGGIGDDTVFGAGGVDTLSGDTGDDLNDGGDFGDLIEDLLGDNVFIGCKGDDTLTSGAGDDILIGLWEDDLIRPGGGRNIISGGWGNDTLLGDGWKDLRGKVVLLDFWHITCEPCITQLPELKSLQERFGDNGLVIIGVHHGATERLADAVKKDNITYPVVADPGETFDRYGMIMGIPAYLLVDQQGNVVARTSDLHKPPRIDEIEPLLPH